MKAILIIWLGIGSHQVLDVERFDSMEECQSASAAIKAYSSRLDGVCLPYPSRSSGTVQVPQFN